jgi:hypothetical protein
MYVCKADAALKNAPNFVTACSSQTSPIQAKKYSTKNTLINGTNTFFKYIF